MVDVGVAALSVGAATATSGEAMLSVRPALVAWPALLPWQRAASGAGLRLQLGKPRLPAKALSASGRFPVSESPAAGGGENSAMPPRPCYATPCTPLRLFI